MKKGIIAILGTITGTIVGAASTNYLQSKEIKLQFEKVEKFKNYYNLLNQWLLLKNENKGLSDYFIKNNYKKIAIYGMGELGSRLVEELKDSDIVIKYAIDKNAGGAYSEIEVRSMDDVLDNVDAVIVTAVFAFDEIEIELSKIVDCPIISLEDVIYVL